MSEPLKYARKMLLLDPDTWDRLSQQPGGLPPALALKRDYQRFQENKIATENETKKNWNKFSQRIQPIITAGVKNASLDITEFFRDKIGKEQDVPVEDAVKFAQAVDGLGGIKYNFEDDRLFVDGKELGEKGSTIILALLRPRGRLTDARRAFLSKLATRASYAMQDEVKNREARGLLLSVRNRGQPGQVGVGRPSRPRKKFPGLSAILPRPTPANARSRAPDRPPSATPGDFYFTPPAGPSSAGINDVKFRPERTPSPLSDEERRKGKAGKRGRSKSTGKKLSKSASPFVPVSSRTRKKLPFTQSGQGLNNNKKRQLSGWKSLF